MRVISGEYKGRKLKAVPGSNTRPTTDKVKESLFNMIGPYFAGGTSLDMFAGSGGLSIEAVSRGIDKAVLFEKDRKALSTIRENIGITKEADKFSLLTGDARRNLLSYLAANEGTVFRLVFLDPPYAQEQYVKDMELLQNLACVDAATTIVCEMTAEKELPEQIGSFYKSRRAVYGTIAIEIFEMK